MDEDIANPIDAVGFVTLWIISVIVTLQELTAVGERFTVCEERTGKRRSSFAIHPGVRLGCEYPDASG
jgi:hypothetical protein